MRPDRECHERLKCYDELAGRKTAAEGMAITKETPSEEEEVPTYLAKLWDLDKESRRGKFAVKFHRSNYILPFTYVENPNEKTVREADSNEN